MNFRRPALAIAALFASAGAVAAVQSSAFLTNAAATIAQLIGLSPDGTKLWVSHAVAGSDPAEFKRSTQLHRALGQQLALDLPDRAELRRLSAQIVAEKARLARIDQERLLRIAFKLSDADRKVLGRYISRSAVEDERDSKPVLQSLP